MKWARLRQFELLALGKQFSIPIDLLCIPICDCHYDQAALDLEADEACGKLRLTQQLAGTEQKLASAP